MRPSDVVTSSDVFSISRLVRARIGENRKRRHSTSLVTTRRLSVVEETPEVGTDGTYALALAALPGAGRLTCGRHGGARWTVASAGRRWGPQASGAATIPRTSTVTLRRPERIGWRSHGVVSRAGGPNGAPISECSVILDSPWTEDVARMRARQRWAPSGGVRTRLPAIDVEIKLARLVLDALGQAQLDSLAELERMVKSRLEGGRSAA